MFGTVRLCVLLCVLVLIQVIASPYTVASAAPIPNSASLMNRALAEPRSIQPKSRVIISRDLQDFKNNNKLNAVKRTISQAETEATLMMKRFWLGMDFAMKGKNTKEKKKEKEGGPDDGYTGF